MKAKEMHSKLKNYVKLMYLNEVNEFKIKQFESFIRDLENIGKDPKQILSLVQQGKYSLSESKKTMLFDLLETSTFPEFENLSSQTPSGVLEMTTISGLGVKRVLTLWRDLGIETLEKLTEEVKNGNVAQLKGFGSKMAENIEESIQFLLANRSKLLHFKAQLLAEKVMEELLHFVPDLKIELLGDLPRSMPVVEEIILGIDASFKRITFDTLNSNELFEKDPKKSTLSTWVGYYFEEHCPIRIEVIPQDRGLHFLKRNSSTEFLNRLDLKSVQNFQDEQEIFNLLNLPYIPAPLREGEHFDFIQSESFDIAKIVKLTDLKGSLHNHSTYSDGQNSISEMVAACKGLGLSYFGISDHSQTASYAGGLKIEDIEKQHREIDDWNSRSTGFRIFKGIESDILPNGDLDYENEILASFDFIVSSVHANLQMSKEEATNRLLKAIENPFTTILGHPTGRILLKRMGYDLDFDKILDACQRNGVVIEINSNPKRLDLDWKYVRKAADKGIMLSINPDAHDTEALKDMEHGLIIAQKCGLYPEQILNCKTVDELSDFFIQKK